MLNTPVSELRRRAPEFKTHAELVEFFRRRKFPRKIGIFGAFERGQIKTPPDRFIELWAAALGVTVDETRQALRETQRMREKKTGPFVRRSRVSRRAA